jgi:hypothetical protein
MWWDGALDDATLHLHFVEAILRGTYTWLSQLIIFQNDAALLQWVLLNLPQKGYFFVKFLRLI